jgi:hypothetical protein
MAVVPEVAQLFFVLLRKNSLKNYALYILAGAALVNTHYYGSLLVLFNFIYYVFINRKQLFAKSAVCFMAVNIIIAFSLLPFFVVTAFKGALLNSGVNTPPPGFNIPTPKLGAWEFITFIGLLSVCFIFALIKKRSKTVKNVSARCNNLPDYAVYAVAFIFMSAFLISLKRPILMWRYLSVCLPLILTIPPAIVLKIHYGELHFVPRFAFLIIAIWFSYRFTLFGGGYNDVAKEAQEYISADAGAYLLKAAELVYAYPIFQQIPQNMMSYYNLEEITPYSNVVNCDVVYVNPLFITDEKGMLRLLADAGLDGENILRVKAPNSKYILKKYLLRDTGD